VIDDLPEHNKTISKMPCFTESDVQELGEQCLPNLIVGSCPPEDLCAPFHDEARQLETELMSLYRATVMCVRREEDINRVAARWGEMVEICEGVLLGFKRYQKSTLAAGRVFTMTAFLNSEAKCRRLQEMHQ